MAKVETKMYVPTFPLFDFAEDVKYPPFNLINAGEGVNVLEMAVAGFKREELTITVEKDMLVISGKVENPDTRTFITRELSKRAFRRKFRLFHNSEVESADLEDGILTVVIKQHIPEKDKPKVIDIGKNPEYTLLQE